MASLSNPTTITTITATSKSLSPTNFSSKYPIPNSLFFPSSQSFLHYPGDLHSRRSVRRRVSVVTRAGATAGQFFFAFAFPLSLLAITAFTAFRIGDRLDQKFLEELAMNEAIREAEEAGDDDVAEVATPRKEEPAPALPRTRNRPKREI